VLEYHGQLGKDSYVSYLDTLRRFHLRPTKVKTPVLVLGAKNDAIFEPSEIAATARAYRTKEFMVDSMAHDMMLEAGWEKVTEETVRWLRRTVSG
jgi:alpha-beta hydrolase superfamily lysophospholipase